MESRSPFQMRASALREAEVRAQESVGMRPSRRKARILVVDDSPDALTLLRLFLSAEGFEVITARGGAEALQLVPRQLPDLVITDYEMPEATGLDLCPHLRSHRETHHIPILLHTGSDLYPPQTALYDAIFAKPASPAQLVHKVRSL